MTVFAIILAAGSGKRFGGEGKKQFLNLSGRPIVIHSLLRFQSSPLIDQIICVVPEGDYLFAEDLIAGYPISKVVKVMPGGAQRQDSVAEAVFYLEQNASGDDLVVIHDAVRPLVTNMLISTLVHKAKSCGAVVAARRVTDSLKKVSADGVIQNSIPRSGTWAMQTPQVFRLSMLAEAYRKGRNDQFVATDDAMLVERLGVAVLCIEGPLENIKVTNAMDLRMAEFFLSEQSEWPAPS